MAIISMVYSETSSMLGLRMAIRFAYCMKLYAPNAEAFEILPKSTEQLHQLTRLRNKLYYKLWHTALSKQTKIREANIELAPLMIMVDILNEWEKLSNHRVLEFEEHYYIYIFN